MPHVRLEISAEVHRSALVAGASVFPHASARVAKESLLVILLVLTAAALVTLAMLLPAEFFGATNPSAGCATLDQWSLASPSCSAVI